MARYKPTSFELKLARLQFGYKQRVELYNQLIALLSTGMQLVDALQMAWDVASLEGKKPKEMNAIVLDNIIRKKQDGASFAQSIKPWVPAEDVMVMEAIENTTDMPSNLRDYLELLERKKKIKGTIVGGVAYPALLVAMVFGIMTYFGAKVVPTISQLLPMEKWTGAATFLRFMYNFSQSMALPVLASIGFTIVVITALLPRWKNSGRIIADRLPVFSTYRMYTGISFLMSMASLLQSGMPPAQALERLHPEANPYVKNRILKVRAQMLSGANFGAALYRAKTGWPDTKMNLNIKIFAETQDLSKQLTRLSKSWIEQAQADISKNMGLLRTISMIMVFGVIMGIVGGIYALQSQIAASVNAM
ncbi:type II secretion system F family protein [Paracoccus litorisediminis]|uniref:type II secretion system F family protein n=1 Tax=Paracoccus litorisediminis TaxID=2006130 RepID=UPI003733B950